MRWIPLGLSVVLFSCIQLGPQFPKSVNVHESVPLGGKAADFTLPRPTGEPVQLSSYQGKVVLLCFFSLF